MRDELHLMELVDHYLDGGMGEAERAAFEERLRTNAELRGLVDDQRALREGLQRVRLRTALTAAHRSWAIRRWAPWAIAGFCVLAAGGWLMSTTKEQDAHPEVPPAARNEAPATMQVVYPASDTLSEEFDVDTRVETVFMQAVAPVRQALDSSRGEGLIVTRLITEESSAVDEQEEVQEKQQLGKAAAISPKYAVPPPSRTWGAEDENYRSAQADSSVSCALQPDVQKMVLATVERLENATKPEFPGGIEALERYIDENLKQPRGTKKTGMVTVGFTVNKKGEVVNVSVLRSLGRAFDAEAVRVVSAMPVWEPSRIGDRAVKSKLEVHVRFRGPSAKPRVK